MLPTWGQQLTNKTVSFVMPALNEEAYLEKAVESVLNQALPSYYSLELIIALSKSRDKTARIAKKLEKQHEQVTVVSNKKGGTSAGLNLAIEQAVGEVIIRVDAHSELPIDYASLGIEILEQTKAANVGGKMLAVGQTDFEKAVAWAYGSRFGIGGGAFHVGGKAGPVDSVYLGIFDKKKLIEVGGFDEATVRGQDWELNLRLRQAGYTVWFDPRLEVTYRPRNSWLKLARQFYLTGKWRGKLARKGLQGQNLRYFAPPLLVFGSLFIFPIAIYLASIAVIALFARLDFGAKLRLFVVLPTMHYFWGLGFIIGNLFRPQINR
jgi:succinoglycan biosynthesis protein ExoA